MLVRYRDSTKVVYSFGKMYNPIYNLQYLRIASTNRTSSLGVPLSFQCQNGLLMDYHNISKVIYTLLKYYLRQIYNCPNVKALKYPYSKALLR